MTEIFTVSWEIMTPTRAHATVNGIYVGYVTILPKPNDDAHAVIKYRCHRDSWSRGLREINAGAQIDRINLRGWSHYAVRAFVDYYSGDPTIGRNPVKIER